MKNKINIMFIIRGCDNYFTFLCDFTTMASASASDLGLVDTGDKGFNAVQSKFFECAGKTAKILNDPNSTLLELTQAENNITDQATFVMNVLHEFTSQMISLGKSTPTLDLPVAVDVALKSAAREGIRSMLIKTIATSAIVADNVREAYVVKETQKHSNICQKFTRLMEDVKDFYETFDPLKVNIARPKKAVEVVLKKFSIEYSSDKLAEIRGKIPCSNNKKTNGCTKVSSGCQYLHAKRAGATN